MRAVSAYFAGRSRRVSSSFLGFCFASITASGTVKSAAGERPMRLLFMYVSFVSLRVLLLSARGGFYRPAGGDVGEGEPQKARAHAAAATGKCAETAHVARLQPYDRARLSCSSSMD